MMNLFSTLKTAGPGMMALLLIVPSFSGCSEDSRTAGGNPRRGGNTAADASSAMDGSLTMDGSSTLDSGQAADATAAIDSGAQPPVSIPDPGTNASSGNWTVSGTHDTPQTAAPMGVVMNGVLQPYLQDDNTATSDTFWVFRAGVSGTFIAAIGGAENAIEYLHLHDGTGLVFGAELDATAFVENGTSFQQKNWDIVENNIYVLEVRIPGGGFF